MGSTSTRGPLVGLVDDAGDDEEEEGAACQPSTMDHHLLACSFAWRGRRKNQTLLARSTD